MSTFAKIMVVVNFVLAIAFLAAAGTLHGSAESWKERHSSDTTRLNTDVKNLQDQLRAKQTDLDNARSEAATARAEADAHKGQLKALNDTNATLVRDLETGHGELAKLLAANADSSKAVSDQTARNEALSNQLATSEADRKKVQEQLATSDENLARATAQADSAEKAVAAHEAKIKTMTDELDAKNTELVGYKTKYPPLGIAPVAALAGVIQAGSAKDDVFIISVGSKDGVHLGDEFTVSRGDHYVSTIVVDQVMQNHSSAHTVPNMKKMDAQPGDAIHTKTGL